LREDSSLSGLKPRSFECSYVRPEGRTLQGRTQGLKYLRENLTFAR
jgi:hypothetical protein